MSELLFSADFKGCLVGAYLVNIEVHGQYLQFGIIIFVLLICLTFRIIFFGVCLKCDCWTCLLSDGAPSPQHAAVTQDCYLCCVAVLSAEQNVLNTKRNWSLGPGASKLQSQ